MKFVSPWLRRRKLSRPRIEIKTSIGRFGEKGGYIMKEEMQKKLFCKIYVRYFHKTFTRNNIAIVQVSSKNYNLRCKESL